MKRIYDTLVTHHLKSYDQMVFLVGPRQVGKTTISKNCKELTKDFIYLNWDLEEDQLLLLDGPSKVIKSYELQEAGVKKKILVLDEFHKYPKWKNYLKGMYDKYNETVQFIVTGSAKLNIFRYSGDSLMGRYFPYRVHPFSVRELLSTTLPIKSNLIQQPKKIDQDMFTALVRYGGFPAPLLKQDDEFYRKWIQLRADQLFNEDVRDMTRINELAQLKLLSRILETQVGQLLNYTTLANKVRVTVDTTQSWVNALEGFFFCFLIKPWTNNIARSLIKNPKLYLWNWAGVDDVGARYENMVACHLKKAVDFWKDTGKGNFDLFFVRDKEKNEVDFVVTQDNKPWFLVEVKTSRTTGISENLYRFQEQTEAKHAFQVVFDLPYTEKDCFDYTRPVVISAETFLSQLV